MEFIDHYKILNIPENATIDDIKKAFRNLAKEFHPDKNKSIDANTRFREIFESYEILKDKITKEIFNEQRKKYYKTSNTDFNPENEPIYDAYDFVKKEASRKAEYFSRMTFDEFLKSSIFILKKTTSKLAISLMFIFGLIIIIFGIYASANINDNNGYGFLILLFSFAFGGTLIYIAKNEF